MNPMNRSRAFTLVELLVVVAIVVLLISLLLPTLSKAKDRTKQVRCAANLHEIGIALNAYAHNNKGIVVNGCYYFPATIQQCFWPESLWVDGVVTVRSNQIKGNSYPTITDANGNTISYPMLKGTSGQNFVCGRGVFYCPGYQLPESSLAGGGSGVYAATAATYGFGVFAGSVLWGSGGSWGVGANVGDGPNNLPRSHFNIMRPQYWVPSHIVLCDGGAGMFRTGAGWGSQYPDVKQRHFNGANYLMGDMSVEWNRDSYADVPFATNGNVWTHEPYGKRGTNGG
ncbi:MAG: prepilin-type N-terminal cleavage/methylation domain-containing protein [Phycisphaerales bacterium]|nr:prepilin-type N-terminal cleavage/methylation domain-containing protein [Phycisphaerales bacterium]